MRKVVVTGYVTLDGVMEGTRTFSSGAALIYRPGKGETK